MKYEIKRNRKRQSKTEIRNIVRQVEEALPKYEGKWLWRSW